MFLGKTLRVFAATLVLTSSITFAGGEGTGSTNSQDGQSQGTAAAISPLTTVESFGIGEEFPDGEKRETQVEFVPVENPEDLPGAEEYVKNEIEKNRKENGKLNALNVDPNAASRESLKKVLADEPKPVTQAELNLPRGWTANLQKFSDTLINQVKPEPGFRDRWDESRTDYNKHVKEFYTGTVLKGKPRNEFFGWALIRVLSNTASPLLTAVVFSHIPIHSALPYCIALGSMSGVMSLVSPALPQNHKLPLPAKTTFWKIVNDGIVKYSVWTLEEIVFLGVARGLMIHANSQLMLHGFAAVIAVETVKQMLGKTTLFGLTTQGTYENVTGKIKNDELAKFKEEKERTPEEIKAVEQNLMSMTVRRNGVISVLYVLLASNQLHSAVWATLGFGIFQGGAISYAVYGYREQLKGFYFKTKDKVQDLYEKSASTTEELIKKCDNSLSNLRQRLFPTK